jgi:ribonuclease HI
MFCDGGSRGNPGPAAIGVVIQGDNEEVLDKIARSIGRATNNQAEYQAVIIGLEHLVVLKEKHQWIDLEIDCYLDSKLLVEQLNQRWKIKNEGIKPLFWKVRELLLSLGGTVTFEHIRREKNLWADQLVNQALDQEAK